MKNKEWLDELFQLHKEESTEEQSKKELDELEKMLEAAITKKKQEPQSDWDRIQAAREFNQSKGTQTAHIRDFSLKSYLINDQQAKDLFTTYLQNKGYNIDCKEETYKSDVTASKDGKSVLFELEITSVDFEKEWPYKYVHFLARKQRYYKEQGNFHYVIISKNGKYALTAQAKHIFKQDNYITRECSRDGVTGVDEFFRLEPQEVKFFKL